MAPRFTLVLLGLLAPLGVAHAEHLEDIDDTPVTAFSAADQSALTPGIQRAEATGAGFAFASTSYSSASSSGSLDVYGQLHLYDKLYLVLRADDITHTGRPGIGAAYQFLSEKKQGVAGTAYVFYKTEGFTEIEGEIEAVASFGKQLGPMRGVLNLAYGQDAEAKERDGEVALDLHTTVIENRMLAGVVGRYRDALGSGGDKGVLRDVFGGVATTVGVGPLGLTAMAGFAGVETSATHSLATGAAATLAVGGGF